MNFLSGQTPGIDGAARAANAAADQVQAYVNGLEPIVAQARQSWRGSAPPAFEAKHEEFRTTAARFIARLREFGGGLMQTSAAYQGANDDATAAVNAAQAAAPYGGALGGSVGR